MRTEPHVPRCADRCHPVAGISFRTVRGSSLLACKHYTLLSIALCAERTYITAGPTPEGTIVKAGLDGAGIRTVQARKQSQPAASHSQKRVHRGTNPSAAQGHDSRPAPTVMSLPCRMHTTAHRSASLGRFPLAPSSHVCPTARLLTWTWAMCSRSATHQLCMCAATRPSTGHLLQVGVARRTTSHTTASVRRGKSESCL